MITEYFMAPDDASAAATIDRVGGPSSEAPTPARRGLFRRSAPAAEPLSSYAVVDGGSIEPTVQGSTVQALLTNRDMDEVFDENMELDQIVASRDNNERLVLRLPDALATALANASNGRLEEVAVPWSETEEFWGHGDPQALGGFLIELADLVRDSEGMHLYCWLCV